MSLLHTLFYYYQFYFFRLTSTFIFIFTEPTRLPHEKAVLFYFDWVISILFGFELLFKVISLGLVNHEGAYLRDGWNVLDCIIVIISFLSLSITGAKAGKYKSEESDASRIWKAL